MVARAYDDRGRSHKVTITPLALLDLMLVTDYIPPLRAILPIAVRSALEGDGALLARMVRDSSALDVLGSPRDFSTARYATVCETEPMPWDPGTPIDQRPAVVAAADRARCRRTRSRRSTRRSSSGTRSTCACAGRTSRARPRPPRRCRIPTMPTLILQGGEDLRTPPEVSARVAARIPGSVRLVVPGTGHSTVSDPRTCSRDAIDRFIARQVARRSRRASGSRPASRPSSARPKSFESLRVSGGLPRKIGRTVSALGATLDDLRLVVSPAALATSGGGLRGGSWSIDGDRLVLKRYEAVNGVTVTGSGNATDHAARLRDPRPRAERSRCAPAAVCPGRSAGAASRCAFGAPDIAAAKALQALKLAR